MRVISGQFGGRTLVAPRGRDTRPTSDRVREALFSILGSVAGARVLDLFAGSGALAIEALSRGAAQAKPWELEKVYDTMIQWAGVGKTVSLDKLCRALGLPGKVSRCNGTETSMP